MYERGAAFWSRPLSVSKLQYIFSSETDGRHDRMRHIMSGRLRDIPHALFLCALGGVACLVCLVIAQAALLDDGFELVDAQAGLG